jgi:putative membrane protein
MEGKPDVVGSVPAGTGSRPDDSRLRLGMETTLLIWIRTGLALMGFGFVLARFGLFLEELAARQARPRPVHISLWFGIILIVLGVAVNLLAAWMHWPYLRRARSGETDLPQTWKLALALAVLSAVAGAAMAILLTIMDRWPLS